MAGFYGVYLAKQLSQRSQGIRTNQMGRGNKELRTLTVERLLAAFSVLIVVVEVWSVVRGYSFLPRWCGWIGLALTALGVVFFTTGQLEGRNIPGREDRTGHFRHLQNQPQPGFRRF